MADGHLTDIPKDSAYSSIVPLRGLWILMFVSEFNGLVAWLIDVPSAYLEAFTSEKVCIIAGPKYGLLQGHLLIMVKAQYGLRISGVH